MNSRYKVKLVVRYSNIADESIEPDHFGYGENRQEAIHDAVERRWQAPDRKFIKAVDWRECALDESRETVFSGATA
jgi:hypothetical protein